MGPNGAGKTTTISMISTVLLPTEGEILVDGKRLDRKEAIRYLSSAGNQAALRATTLEDVFVDCAGRKL